ETQNVTILDGIQIATTFTTTAVTCNGGNDGTATVTASNGTTPYTYAWNTTPTQTTQTATGLAAGTYTVTITDANGCSRSVPTTITQPPLITVTTASTNVSCNAGTNGTITVTNTTTGTPTVQYSINGGTTWQTTNTFTGLAAGTYTISTQFANGTCTMTSPSVTITQPTQLTLSNTTTDASCNSSGDGTATVIPTGGTAGYTYLWNTTPAQTTATAIGLNQGNVTVTVTDANGCTAANTATVSVPSPIILTTTVTDLSCFGATDGTATVSATGGSGTYTYVWNTTPAQTTQTANNLSAGTKIVTVTDANGCFDTAHVQITGQVLMNISFTTTDVYCFGGNDGDATVNVTNGNTPYNYNWNTTPNQTTQTATTLSANTYTVTITDAIGCIGIDSVVINQLPQIQSAVDSIPLLCFEDGTGSAIVTASGGTAPYTYLWDANANNQTTDTASNLMAGTYFVTVTGANGCTTVNSIEVTQPAALVLTSGANAVSCSGGNNGLAYVIASGGTYPYYYTWSDAGNQVTDTAFNLLSSNYLVYVTDANGCEPTDTIFVPQPAPLSVSMSATAITCFGANDGTALVNTLGGTTPYNFAWNTTPVQTDSLALGLSAGWAIVTVTDANNCDIIDSVLITEPTQIITSVTGTDANCNGGTDGTATVTVTGGVSGYTYTWDGILATNTITNLAAGWHYVLVTDATGCSVLDSILTNEPAPILLTTSMTSVSCSGGTNGTATVTATGGAGGFSYQWNTTPAQFTATATALNTGTYNVTVTDMNGCINTANIQVTTPNPLTTTLTPTNINCFGATTGSIVNGISGGVPGYTFVWSNGANTQNLAAIPAGTYTVTITDINGCNISQTTTVTQPTAPVAINIDGVNVTCHGGNNGTATATVTGGTAPYQYSWNTIPQQVTPIASGLAIGTYTLTVTDSKGCTQTKNIVINQPNQVNATLTATNITCFGGSNGSIQTIITGGTSPYTFAWSNGLGTVQNPQNLTTGNYTVTITDANNCTLILSKNITQPTALSAVSTFVNPTCNNTANGSIQTSISGGTSPYIFAWSNGLGTVQNPQNVAAGNYTVTITDANNCTTTATATLTAPSAISATFTNISASCFNTNDGAIVMTNSGGMSPYTYVWSNGLGTIQNPQNVGNGNYTVTITDVNNCTNTVTTNISSPSAIIISTTKTPPACGLNGSITANVSGGNPPYNYTWNPNANTGNSNIADSLLGGNYWFTVTDASGCSEISTIVNFASSSNLVVTSAIIQPKCEAQTGSIGITPISGVAPFTYTWTPNANAGNVNVVNNLAGGFYSVTVTDAFGCDTILSYTLNPAIVLAGNATVTNTTCGQDNGSIIYNINSGISPYTYAWSNTPANTNTITDLAAGDYDLVITDAENCSILETITVSASDGLMIRDSVIQIGCEDAAGIYLTISGGNQPYNYVWSANSNTGNSPNATNLITGTYDVTITDVDNCMATASYFVNEITPFTLETTEQIDNNCFEGSDGSITVNAINATNPINYSWSNGQNGQTATGLAAGNYSVSVTDIITNCQQTQSFTITEPAEYMIDIGTDFVVEIGTEVTLQVNNPRFEYTYNWDGTNGFTDSGTSISSIINENTTFTVLGLLSGCPPVQAVINIKVTSSGEIEIPNAFSPNNDGKNDLFRIATLLPIQIMDFKVFNRYGEIIYDDAQGEWNGTHNGKKRQTVVIFISFNIFRQ
ncbi:MAG: T9SS type B sorting domain-containing protein, partial [Saprospiraceae bacterium]|nr:T9SS type B sorting domain-containing protein [Saprospiraceae bacterium]